MSRIDRNKAQGFTLVELLVVMLVLVALSSITLDFTKDFAFQGRYEVTKDRYDKIKRAIIGRPDVLINGQPDISGFVADMGRLPRNIQELLVQNYCSDDYRVSDNTPSLSGITDATGTTPKEWCTSKTPNGVWHSASCTDKTKTTLATCTGSEVWSEWKGPYLTTQKPDYEENAFSDGWGNEAIVLTDHNYGWTVCVGAMAANGCYTSSPVIVADELIILSKGKNGSISTTDTGYDKDYPEITTQPVITSLDFSKSFTSGFNLMIKKDNSSTGGSCGFSQSLSTSLAGNVSACRNAAGITGSACVLNETACNSKSGSWEAINNRCDFISGTCTSAGGDWDTATSTCHLTKVACAAITGAQWTAAIPLVLPAAICAAKGGVSDPLTGICKFSGATAGARCNGTTTGSDMSGIWDSATNSCDYKNDVSPSDTPSNWAMSNGGTWGCAISQKSCNAGGGAWRRCDFDPSTCNGFTGGTSTNSCEFTSSSCTRSGGAWNPLARTCSTVAANETACTNNGGNWNTYCGFASQANCTSAGGDIWDGTTSQCEFSSSNCFASGGLPRLGDCSIENAEDSNISFNKQSCEQASGIWKNKRRYICLNIEHHGVIDSSNPIAIIDDGNYETINFSFSTSPKIRAGVGYVSVHEYDGDCNVANPYYPSSKSNKMSVLFVPNMNLAPIVW